MLAQVKERLGTELERVSRELASSMMTAPDGSRQTEVVLSDAERKALQIRIRRLGQLVAGLPSLADDSLPADRAGYGTEVEVEDLQSGRRERLLLVTGEVRDLGENHVRLGSPLGQALLGRRAGERITVDLPQGRRNLRIVSLVTLPRMLGLTRARARARA